MGSSDWDIDQIGQGMKNGLSVMGIPIPQDWNGIRCFIQDRKEEVLAEFSSKNKDGKMDLVEFTISFLMSDVINYLPKEEAGVEGADTQGPSSSYTLTFEQIQRMAEEIVEYQCSKWLSHFRKRGETPPTLLDTKILKHVIETCVATCAPNKDQIDLVSPNGEFYGWEARIPSQVEFLMSLDKELQAQQLEELKRMRKNKDNELLSRAAIARLTRPFTRSASQVTEGPSSRAAPSGYTSETPPKKAVAAQHQDSAAGRLNKVDKQPEIPQKHLTKEASNPSEYQGLHPATQTDSLADANGNKDEHPLRKATPEDPLSSPNSNSTAPEIDALFATPSGSIDQEQENGECAVSTSPDKPESEPMSISLDAMERDDIFIFLPGSSMDDTPSCSIEIQDTGHWPEGHSDSEPPPISTSKGRPDSETADATQDYGFLPVGNDAVKNGLEKDAAQEQQKKRKYLEGLYEQKTHATSNPSMEDTLNAASKRRKYLHVESQCEPEENAGITTASTNEPDPFDILEDAGKSTCEEELDSSVTPHPLSWFLGPVWDRYGDEVGFP